MDMYTAMWLHKEHALLEAARAASTTHPRRTSNTTRRSTPGRNRRTTTAAAACIALTMAFAGCSDDASVTEAVAASGTTAAAPTTTVGADTVPPSTTPTTDRPAAPATTIGAAPVARGDDDLAAEIEAVLAEAIAPGSIRWDANGVDVPATAAVAGVRIPGRDDVLVATGDNVDGTPTEANAPFSVASLTESLVRSVAFQLVDEGVLDPTRTVDEWVPTLPNAERVTVQMLIDNETGWSDWGPIDPDPVTTDFARAWTLREAVELRATAMTALGEPGTRTDDGLSGEGVLALVVQEVTGQPLAELVRQRVSEAAGLHDTGLLDGRTSPPGFRHGAFAYGTTPASTADFVPTSYITWNHAGFSAVSTPIDLLDLLDAWATGALFTTDRTPAPDRFAPDPAGNPDTRVGLGVPFNGYCPCTDVAGGVEPTAIGRAPGAIGTRTFLLRYADGISVVVNVNSSESDPADIEAVATAVHDLAAATR